MLTMSAYSEKSWNSSEDYEDDNSSTSSPVQSVQRRINNGEMVEMNGNSVITTHCVSSVIKPGDKQLHDPLQFVKIKSTELSQKAKEQIKLAEEVKITKEKIKEVEEEWQNNLLSWKSKRRQSKRNNSEDEFEDRNSIDNPRKVKTFNEILNEKAKSGHRIGYNLHHYLMNEEEDNLIDQSTVSNSSTDHTDHSNVDQHIKSSINELNDQKNRQTPDDQSESEVVSNANHLKEYNNLSQIEIAQNNLNNMYNKDQSRQTNHLNDSQTSINSNNSSLCKSIMTRSNKISEIGQQLTNRLSDRKQNASGSQDDEKPEQENKKLSFKAKLSAFENLAKTEPKKAIEKTPPVKNKLRMSSSNNLIADKKREDKQDQNAALSKRFTSRSNENLSKFDKANRTDRDKHLKRSEFNSTKSESNLNSVNQEVSSYQNIQNVQFDQQLNNDEEHNTQTVINRNDDPLDIRSSNEVMPNKDTKNLQQSDCDYEVSELSKRMQHQCSTSPTLAHQPSATQLNTHSNHSIHSSIQQENLQQRPFANSLQDLNASSTKTSNYFNDDYANTQIHNHQQASHNLVNDRTEQNQLPVDYAVDSSQQQQIAQQPNQLYQPISNKQIISAPMLPQSTGNYYYEENFGVYGNYYDDQGANAYQLQKHNRSTSSSHLEYTNGLPPVANQMYYHNKSSVINTSGGNLNNLNYNCLAAQSYTASQLMNRQSQPHLNQTQSTQPTQSYNYNHWLVQEAEYRRQMATRNGSSLIASTKNQQLLLLQNQVDKTSTSNLYKDDQPVYENTVIYNSHKQQQLQQQQSSANSMPYLSGQQQINKPPYPNPTIIANNQTSLIQHTNGNLSRPQNYPSQQEEQQKQILSVSGKKKCSNCGDELGRGCAAMVIETLSLYYHINCFRCSVCHIILGNGSCGTDVRVRDNKLHCLMCYSNDQGKGIFY